VAAVNMYIAEESANKRFIGALFLSMAIHLAILLLVKTSGWGVGFTNVGLNAGGPIAVQFGYTAFSGSEPSTSRSKVPTEPAVTSQAAEVVQRKEVSVATNLQKPAALPRPEVQPSIRSGSVSAPVVERRPEPKTEQTPVPEPQPKPQPEPKVEQPVVETRQTIEPVIEVQRQPIDEPAEMQSVLTSPTGTTTVPIEDLHAEPEQTTSTETTVIDEPAVEQPVESPDSDASIADMAPEEPVHSNSEADGGSVTEAAKMTGESTGKAAGSPPTPPPAGGDMLGLGGRLVYPKAAETARGGPIEYSVTFEVLVSKTGVVIEISVLNSWFDRDLDERTAADLIKTSELMMRSLLIFGPYTSDYRMTVTLSFDAEKGPTLTPESRIRPVSD